VESFSCGDRSKSLKNATMERGKGLVRMLEHAVFVVALFRLFRFWKLFGMAGVMRAIVSKVVAGTKAMPGLKGVIEGEIAKEVDKIEEKMLGDGDEDANISLPERGTDADSLFQQAKQLHLKDNFSTGQKWAGIYHDVIGDSELEELQNKMWALFNNSNNLYPGIFKSTRKFEAELVQMTVDLLHGSDETCGLLTSGGTESILLALLGYRELARERGIEEPEVICATSAHGALDKACFYFGLKLVKTDADPKTFRLEAHQVEKLISPNTICVYASAPSFPFGTVDPIDEIAEVTRPRKIGLHVDNCLGGFYLSSLKAVGLWDRKFDFEVDGVTSISIDVHKYGFAPKGVSIVIFSSPHLRNLTVHPVTSGLTLYVTPTLQGSRGGGVIAAAWATVMYVGAEGYEEYARKFHALKQKVEEFVAKEVPGLYVPVQSDLSIIPMASDEYDVYAVSSLLEKKGWSSFTSQNPPLLQICIGEQHFRVIDQWLQDLKEAAATVRQNPNLKVEGDAAVYGAAKNIPQEILGDLMREYIAVKMKVKPKRK